jgi:hypothetical protein
VHSSMVNHTLHLDGETKSDDVCLWIFVCMVRQQTTTAARQATNVAFTRADGPSDVTDGASSGNPSNIYMIRLFDGPSVVRRVRVIMQVDLSISIIIMIAYARRKIKY